MWRPYPGVLSPRCQQRVLDGIQARTELVAMKCRHVKMTAEQNAWPALGARSTELVESADCLYSYILSNGLLLCGTTKGCDDLAEKIDELVSVAEKVKELKLYCISVLQGEVSNDTSIYRRFLVGNLKLFKITRELTRLQGSLSSAVIGGKEILEDAGSIPSPRFVKSKKKELMNIHHELSCRSLVITNLGSDESLEKFLWRLNAFQKRLQYFLKVVDEVLEVPWCRRYFPVIYVKDGYLDLLDKEISLLTGTFKKIEKKREITEDNREVYGKIRSIFYQMSKELEQPRGVSK